MGILNNEGEICLYEPFRGFVKSSGNFVLFHYIPGRSELVLVPQNLMKKITDFEELQCRKLAVRLYQEMTELTRKKKIDCNDELVCRRLVSGLHISGKIAFAFGAEDHERFLERLPLAKKYCLECAFRSEIMYQKKLLKKKDLQEIDAVLKRIVRKINAIIRYLEKYSDQEKYARQVFFDHQEI